MVHPNDRHAYFEHLNRIALQSAAPFCEIRVHGAEDQIRDICLYARAIRKNRQGVHWQFALVDVTERKRAEEALLASNQDLNEFNYALVHNIKAPFRAVKNYANFLVEDLADSLQGDTKKFLEGIQKAVDEAHRQFHDLEALYHIRNHTIEYESLDVKRDVLNEIATVHQTAPERQLIIADNWPTVRGERYLLRQILSELIENGYKYNRSDVKKVEVSWQRAADKRLEIVVSDNGIGIDPRYHEHIFHIFKRLHTEAAYEGTGIGLSIVKRAVMRLDGAVKLESAVGEGSMFIISLPAAVVEDGRQASSFGAADTPT